MLLMVVQQLVALLEAKEDNHREDDVENEEGAVEGGHGVDAGHKGKTIKKVEEKGEQSQGSRTSVENLFPVSCQQEEVVDEEVQVEKSWWTKMMGV